MVSAVANDLTPEDQQRIERLINEKTQGAGATGELAWKYANNHQLFTTTGAVVAEQAAHFARDAFALRNLLTAYQQVTQERDHAAIPIEDREQLYGLLESAEVFGPSPLADFRRLLRLPEQP